LILEFVLSASIPFGATLDGASKSPRINQGEFDQFRAISAIKGIVDATGERAFGGFRKSNCIRRGRRP
jgi:hypothetical protein